MLINFCSLALDSPAASDGDGVGSPLGLGATLDSLLRSHANFYFSLTSGVVLRQWYWCGGPQLVAKKKSHLHSMFSGSGF